MIRIRTAVCITVVTAAFVGHAFNAFFAFGENDYSELAYVLLATGLFAFIMAHRCRPAPAPPSRMIRIGGARTTCPECHRTTAFAHVVDAVDLDGYERLATHTHCIACEYCHITDSRQEASS